MHSLRFTTFPQEIVIATDEPVQIQQIQILSHEYKIPTKVEVHVGTPSPGDPDARRCSFKRLGYLSFDSNRRSNFQARELKSVMLNTVAQAIKLVPHRCHVNSLNIYNQVGIVALNIIGERAASAAGAGADPGNMIVPSAMHRANGPMTVPSTEDITLDLQVDSLTAEKIRSLEVEKRAAVKDERYDDAKFFKDQIDKLRMLGKKIAELEAHKRRAVEVEDYSTAKVLKAEVDRLRAAGAENLDDAAQKQSVHDSRPRVKDPMELFNRVLPPEERAKQAETILSASQEGIPAVNISAFHQQQYDEVVASPEAMKHSPPSIPIPPAAVPSPMPAASALSPVAMRPDTVPEPLGPAANAYVPHDEKLLPVPARAQGLMEPAAEDNTPPELPQPEDLPPPEPIPASLTAEAEPFVELFGERLAQCIMSKNWQLREAGIDEVAQAIVDGSVSGGREASYPTCVKLLSRAFKDRVPGVFHAGVRLMDALVEHSGPEVGERNFQSRIGEAVARLMERFGDVNQRVRTVSAETIQMLANHEVCGLGVVASYATRPVKNAAAAKPLIGRLEVLNQLVETHGVTANLSADAVMSIARVGLDHPSGEVRDAAVQLSASVHGHVGQAVEKHLKGVKPALRELLNAEFSGVAVVKKGTPGHKQAKSKVQSFSSAPPPRRAPASQPKSGVGAKKQHAPSNVQPAPQSDGGPGAAMDDDEPPPRSEKELPGLKKVLIDSEAKYGPDHAVVAQALSELAVLHNELGHADEARPLFERALVIWENDPNYGPEHSDVAQTLTDLAVLHIESGRHTVGRPLLERAMLIQEKTLGTHHPDVEAIRDVLQSLDQEDA